MAGERLHAVTGRHLPHLDRLVPAGRHDEIPGGHEGDAGHVVVVTEHRPDALVRLLYIPEFDGHVRAARDQQLSARIERDILNGVGVALEGPLVLAGLEIPHLDRGVLASRDHHAEHGMEDDTCYRRPVTCTDTVSHHVMIVQIKHFTKLQHETFRIS